jgi:hypothetical protein
MNARIIIATTVIALGLPLAHAKSTNTEEPRSVTSAFLIIERNSSDIQRLTDGLPNMARGGEYDAAVFISRFQGD